MTNIRDKKVLITGVSSGLVCGLAQKILEQRTTTITLSFRK